MYDRRPDATAYIQGGPLAPCIKGEALFYQCTDGVEISVRVGGMPTRVSNGGEGNFHGFHIHELGNCTVGDPCNPFLASGGHYNPTNEPHPLHAGDLPPLLANNCGECASAVLSVKTNRITVEEVIGKSVIIHEGVDDFTTQPSGASGKRWACGIIARC